MAVANDWLHISGITVWMGGLGALLWFARQRGDGTLVPAVERFSRLAGWAFIVVLVIGGVDAVLASASWRN